MAERKNSDGRIYSLFSVSIDTVIMAAVRKMIADRTILQSRSKYIESLILDDLKRRKITLNFTAPPHSPSTRKRSKPKS